MAFWYSGIDAANLARIDLLALRSLIPKFTAQQSILLRSTQGELTPDMLKELLVAAWGDEDKADRIAAEFALEKMRRESDA